MRESAQSPSPRKRGEGRGEGLGDFALTFLEASPLPSSGAARHLLPACGEKKERALAAISTVCDPEIPVLTLDDLGVIRRVDIAADGEVEIDITPTYSGCPAMAVMALDLQTALAGAGFPRARIRTVLSPAWTTDWMSAEGRRKLAEYGIAPPAAKASRRVLFGDDDELACPRCKSVQTIKISEFGSTACKSLWRCESCLEPFDAFKCI